MKSVTRAIILDQEGKVLLGKRAGKIATGQYALIGGKSDPEESPEYAIIRKVKEEIGLEFTPIPYLEKIDSHSDPKEPWMVYYFTESAKGELKLEPSEVEEVIFISEDDLDELDIAFDHREKLKEFFQSLISE